ncbi:MAG: outer membrane beta-barrel protein [Bacteroidota bacterium]
MKKIFLTGLFALFNLALQAQNSIGIEVGYLGTHTSVAEYSRVGRTDYLLDSMTLEKNVGSLMIAVTADIDLGKHFFFSPGFHYSNKGLSLITFTDSTGYPWSTAARQHYIGLSALLGYHLPFKNNRFGLQLSTGLQTDFAVGQPNGGALFSGPYSRFFMPFSRFNEVDLSWITELAGSYRLGPGDMVLKISYLYGLGDVLEDPFVIGRTMSFGASVGYSFRLR